MRKYLMMLTLVAFVLATVMPGFEAVAATPNTPVGKGPAKKVAAKKQAATAKKVKTRKKRRPHRRHVRGVTHHYLRSGLVFRNR